MKLSKIVIAATVTAGAVLLSSGAMAQTKAAPKAPANASEQAKEQFFPLLSYRTGPYAPNGTPWANGK